MAKIHSFRLNDLVRIKEESNHYGCGREVIINERSDCNDQYAVIDSKGSTMAWLSADDLILIQHDQHDLLDEWEQIALDEEEDEDEEI